MTDEGLGPPHQEPIPAPPPPPPQPVEPHRGPVVLALGIVGIVACFICGIIAWVMGNHDLEQMRAGRMDPAGRGLTQAGRICGIISVAWAAFAITICALALVLIAALGTFD
jgi:hypothetical protein